MNCTVLPCPASLLKIQETSKQGINFWVSNRGVKEKKCKYLVQTVYGFHQRAFFSCCPGMHTPHECRRAFKPISVQPCWIASIKKHFGFQEKYMTQEVSTSTAFAGAPGLPHHQKVSMIGTIRVVLHGDTNFTQNCLSVFCTLILSLMLFFLSRHSSTFSSSRHPRYSFILCFCFFLCLLVQNSILYVLRTLPSSRSIMWSISSSDIATCPSISCSKAIRSP